MTDVENIAVYDSCREILLFVTHLEKTLLFVTHVENITVYD